MRRIPVFCVLALVGLHATEAEARRLRLRFGVSPAVALPSVALPAAALPVAAAVAVAPPAPPPRLRVAEPAQAVPASPPAPRVKVAEPWCATNRVVGSGAGFCELN